AHRDAGSLERDGGREDGTLQELVRGGEGGVGVAANVAERGVAERLRLLLAHEQHGGGAVSERRRVTGGYRAVLSVEGGAELRELIEGGIAAHAVVARHRDAVDIHGSDLARQASVFGTGPGELVRPQRPAVLFL